MVWSRIAALALAGTLGVSASAASSAERYTLGTNPQGTVYYTIGGGIAAALQKRLGRPVTVQPYAGSSVYVPLISTGEVTMGLNSSLDLGDYYSGQNGKPMMNLRVLARLWPLRVAFVARANLGATKVSELKGKRVVTELSALQAMSKLTKVMLQLSGLGVGDVSQVTIAGLGPGMAGLTENNLDATLIAVGIPLTKQAHASIPGGIRYLSIEGKNATTEKADKLYSGLYLTVVKPTPRLPEVSKPVTVTAFDVYLTVSADLPNDEATAILTALYEGLPQLKKDYPPLGGAAQDQLGKPSNTVPYHDAAKAFFKAKGLWSKDNDAREQALTR